MNIFRRILITAGLAASVSGLACASDIIVTNSATFGPNTTDFTFSSLNVAQDSGVHAGYHLVGITLDVTAASNEPTFSLSNSASTAQSFGLFFGTDINITGNSASSDAVGDTIIVPVFSTGGLPISPTKSIHLGQSGLGACPAGTPSISCSSVSYAPLSGSGDDGAIAISSANWAAYLGTGSVTFSGNTSSSTVFNGGGGNILLTQTTNASVTATLTYDYAPTSAPEPASMVLMGSALVGIGLLRKRVSAK